MSHRLEIVRARNQPDELRAMAADAVRWWVGAPAHAHAVAAGFLARAGDQDAARRELDTVLSLDWRGDRSYLWSIFVGEMTAAAIALDDQQLCRQLLHDLRPVADTCAVNGALVCFMGAHAHRVGLLYAALGQPALAQWWLTKAVQIHRRLGARAWEIESCVELRRLGSDDAQHHAERAAALRGALQLGADVPSLRSAQPRLVRIGDMWQASYRGQSAYLRDMKGLHDLAALLKQPGVDLSSREGVRISSDGADATLDRTALVAYRQRLAELDEEITVAQQRSDLAAQERVTDER
ncbi:MAG TPA: hypothetical protein VJ625_15275 [Propionibacteriaceae bacterium]|nr:hypothetical protein [Propionibacteriaceae bacterium]